MSDVTRGAQSTQTDPFRARPSRRTVVAGAAWAVPAVVGMNALPAWAALSPLPCPDYQYSKVRGASQFLSGTLLGTPLSQVFIDPAYTDAELVSLRGISATFPPWPPSVDPITGYVASETSNGPAYYKQLDLKLLGAISIILGVNLSDLLEMPVGAVNQWAQAVYDGTAVGTSGAVDNSSGAIGFASYNSSTTYASINLKNLLNEALSGGLTYLLGLETGSIVGNYLTDLSLDVGAIAGRAQAGRAWQANCSPCVKRDYLLAWLKLVIESPLLAGVFNALTPVINGLQGTVNGLIGSNSALSMTLGLIEGLINALDLMVEIGGVSVGLALAAEATLSIELDAAAALEALGSDLFPDSALLDLGFGATTISLDLGTLVGNPYAGEDVGTLNNMPPNTNLLNSLLTDPAPVTGLVTELGKIGSNSVDVLRDLITVKLHISITATAALIVPITAEVATVDLYSGSSGTDPASLQDLLDGNFHLEVNLLEDVPILGPLLSTVLLGPLNKVLNGTTVGQNGETVPGLLSTLGTTLDALIEGQVLTTAVNDAITLLTTTVGTLLNKLFVNPQLLRLTVNAQRDPSSACPLPSGEDSPEYDVAALRVALLDDDEYTQGGKLVSLYLARGAVGPINYTTNA